MANKTISELPAALAITDADIQETSQGGSSKKTSRSLEKAYFQSGLASASDARFPTTDEKAALNAAATPSATNPVATMNDLSGISNLPTADEKAAMDGAASPSSTNVFATMADVPADELTADELAAITGATTPSAENVFITESDISGIANLPTADEKAAMTASSSPSATNPFATVSDIPTVDSIGLQGKIQVLIATTGDITLHGEQLIDGVTTNSSRVLVLYQTDQKTNGIYLSSAGDWTRTSDASTGTALLNALVSVSSGTTQAGFVYFNSNTNIIFGTTNITFSLFSNLNINNVPTHAEKIVLGNTSNTNTGDETTSTIKTKLGQAGISTDGWLSSTDWTKFNNGGATQESLTWNGSDSFSTFYANNSISSLSITTQVMIIGNGHTINNSGSQYTNLDKLVFYSGNVNSTVTINDGATANSLPHLAGRVSLQFKTDNYFVVDPTNTYWSISGYANPYSDNVSRKCIQLTGTSGNNMNVHLYGSRLGNSFPNGYPIFNLKNSGTELDIFVTDAETSSTISSHFANGDVDSMLHVVSYANYVLPTEFSGYTGHYFSSYNTSTVMVNPTTDRRYVTDNQKDALDAASTPSSTNPIATIADIPTVDKVGLQGKIQVDVATLLNITLYGEQEIDTYGTGNSRVLVKNQTNQKENGIYVSNPLAWSRASDANTGALLAGALVGVMNGTQTSYIFFNANPNIIFGTTDITFSILDSVNSNAVGVTQDERNALDHAATALSTANPVVDTTTLNTGLGNKVTANAAITGATKTKVTYDAKGLVTSGTDATTADIAASTDKNYVSDNASAAITGAASPSASNVFATIADIPTVDKVGLQGKIQVAVATLIDMTLSGEQHVDGVLTSASRVLVKNQTDQKTNGLYLTGAGDWVRSDDANTGALLAGALVAPTLGTQAGYIFFNQNPNIIFGTTNITFGILDNVNAALTYTTATPTNITVGGIPSGTSFNSVSFSTVIDQMLHIHIEPAFTSFDLGIGLALEQGHYISGNHTFTWTVDHDELIADESCSVYDVTGDRGLFVQQPNTGSKSYNFGSPGVISTSSYVWRMTALTTDMPYVQIARLLTINWQYKKYWGTSTNTSLTSSNVLALANSEISTTAPGSYAFASGGYKYFCIPAAWTQPTIFQDHATGFGIDMQAPVTLSVTNSYGVVCDYSIYRSTYILSSSLTIDVA